jgi:hypothetical protein
MSMRLTKTVPTEEQEHLALMDWIAYQPLLRDIAIHIPNEGKRSWHYGKKLKRLGLRKGVSDLFIPYPTYQHAGLWLEIKKIGGKLTTSQSEWLNKMRDLGFVAEVGFGYDHCVKIIQDYMRGYL